MCVISSTLRAPATASRLVYQKPTKLKEHRPTSSQQR